MIGFQSLSRRKLRSWLTMMGIFIGIAAVISLISLGQGMQNAIVGQFEKIGSDKLFVQPATTFGVMGENTGSKPLTTKDVRFIDGMSGVEESTYWTLTSAKIEYQNNIRYFTVIGSPTDQKKLDLLNSFYGETPYTGRYLNQGDKYSAVVGVHHLEKGLYNGKNMEVGSRFFVNDQKFTVVGAIPVQGNNQDDRMIIVPEKEFRDLTGIEERIDMIIVQANQGQDLRELGDNIERQLGRYRNVKEGDEDFTVQTPEDLLNSFQTILNIVQAVLIGISLISLFVGSIGIMNTMYTSVLERNQEIGIMKAIGAKNADIFKIFLIESGFLGLVGGLLGIILGIGFAKAVEIISTQALGKSFLQAYFSIELIAGALLFSFLLGAIAGTLPAIQASKLQPADTLRDE